MMDGWTLVMVLGFFLIPFLPSLAAFSQGKFRERRSCMGVRMVGFRHGFCILMIPFFPHLAAHFVCLVD